MTGRDLLIGLAALVLFLVVVLIGWAILKVILVFVAFSTLLVVVSVIYVIAITITGLRECWKVSKRWASRKGW